MPPFYTVNQPAQKNLARVGSTGLLLVLLLAGRFFLPDMAWAADSGRRRVVNIQFENDMFGGGTDRHYTHGSRISYLVKLEDGSLHDKQDRFDRTANQLAGKLARSLSLLSRRTQLTNERASRISVLLGQNIFTPEDITINSLQPAEQPYAGWTYAGLGLVTTDRKEKLDYLENLELNIGMVGPASLAEETQREWHRLISVELPQGWDHQLKDEFGILLNYERKYRMMLLDDEAAGRLSMDLTPSWGLALGNIYSYLSTGATVRLGRDLPRDYGPPSIRPGLQGSGFFKAGPRPALYLFAGVEIRAMGRNIFLDGNTWRESHNVDKKPLVGDLQTGVVLSWGRFRGSFTNVFRTREYYGQREKDEFGSINLSVLF